MRRYTDNELGGYALVCDGPLELAREAARAVRLHDSTLKHDEQSITARLHMGDWTGRHFDSFDELIDSFGRPWAAGLATIRNFIEQLSRDQVEAPVSRRRKRRFSELTGDVEVDRVLSREPDFYSSMHRPQQQAPTNVSILCQIGGNYSVSAEDLFWRSAAAVAIVDQLEAAGYSCEVRVWSLASPCFTVQNGRDHCFTTYPLKACGEPVDLDTLACGLSSWFFRLCVMGARYGWQPRRTTGGCGRTVGRLGGWRKYLDVSEGVQVIEMPGVESRSAALAAARQILASVNQPVSF